MLFQLSYSHHEIRRFTLPASSLVGAVWGESNPRPPVENAGKLAGAPPSELQGTVVLAFGVAASLASTTATEDRELASVVAEGQPPD